MQYLTWLDVIVRISKRQTIFLSIINLLLLYVYACFACMYVCVPCVCLVLIEPEEGVGFHGIRLKGGCELPYGCWKLISSHL